MTQEEKARKYDEALERAEVIYQGSYKPDTAATIAETLQNVFPELAESEDERIRKRIIHALHGDVLDMEETNKALAWLEKQGEKPQGKTALDAINEEIVDNANKVDSIKLKEPDVYEYELERIVDKLNEVIGKLGDIYEVLSKPYVFPYRDYTPPNGIPGMDVWYKTHGVEKVTPVTCETLNNIKKENG